MKYQTREHETPTLGVALPSAFPVGSLGKSVEATDVGNVGKIPPGPASSSTTVIVLFTIQVWYDNGPDPQQFWYDDSDPQLVEFPTEVG